MTANTIPKKDKRSNFTGLKWFGAQREKAKAVINTPTLPVLVIASGKPGLGALATARKIRMLETAPMVRPINIIAPTTFQEGMVMLEDIILKEARAMRIPSIYQNRKISDLT